jgi:hypothetical protein
MLNKAARKFASDSGAWQRSEGKNPEGGLNAKGRASLKAQGHDIKPGVKGPANTPEKMKRKGSFLSRMFGPGAPGSMKKDNGEPSRRALSAKAWGEPVPQNDAGRARLYTKGQTLLEKYKNMSKKANLNLKRLETMGAGFGSSPGTVEFTTPSGHTVTTPYSEEAVRHQILRMGGEDAYYKSLAEALKEHAREADRNVEKSRDQEVSQTRAGRAMLGAVLGGGAGALVGALGHKPGVGAALGGLTGGYLGHQAHVDRKSGPTRTEIEEINHLYSVPPHVKAMRERLNALRDEIDQDAFFRDMYQRSDIPYIPRSYYGKYASVFGGEKFAKTAGPLADFGRYAVGRHTLGKNEKQFARRVGGYGGAGLGAALGAVAGGLEGAYDAPRGEGFSSALGGALRGGVIGGAVGGIGGRYAGKALARVNPELTTTLRDRYAGAVDNVKNRIKARRQAARAKAEAAATVDAPAAPAAAQNADADQQAAARRAAANAVRRERYAARVAAEREAQAEAQAQAEARAKARAAKARAKARAEAQAQAQAQAPTPVKRRRAAAAPEAVSVPAENPPERNYGNWRPTAPDATATGTGSSYGPGDHRYYRHAVTATPAPAPARSATSLSPDAAQMREDILGKMGALRYKLASHGSLEQIREHARKTAMAYYGIAIGRGAR